MFDGLDGDVDVEVGPVQVMRGRPLDIQQLRDGGRTKPWKTLERHKQLSVAEQQPKTYGRYVGHFNWGSVFSTPHGFHLRVP